MVMVTARTRGALVNRERPHAATVVVTNGIVTSDFAAPQHLTAWRVGTLVDAPESVELSIRRVARLGGRYRAFHRDGKSWRQVQPGEYYYTTYQAARAAIVRLAAESERLAKLHHRFWRNTLSRARKLPRGAAGRRTRR